MLRMYEATRVLDCAMPLSCDLAIGLLDRGQVDAVRSRAHQLIEHMHDLRPAALELLDDLHAREQALLLLLRGRGSRRSACRARRSRSFRYWLRSFWSSIARLHLPVDDEARSAPASTSAPTRADAEFLALALALRFAPRD